MDEALWTSAARLLTGSNPSEVLAAAAESALNSQDGDAVRWARLVRMAGGGGGRETAVWALAKAAESEGGGWGVGDIPADYLEALLGGEGASRGGVTLG